MPTPIALRPVDEAAGAVVPRAGLVVDAMAISHCGTRSWLGENHGAVSILRRIFGPDILVISGQAA